MRRIGVLSGFAADDPEGQARIAAFRRGMQEQGWSEGRNLQIDYRWAGTDAGRIKAFAADLVGTSPRVILALSSPSGSGGVREATRTVPVVFVGISDPVGQGFVASFAQPWTSMSQRFSQGSRFSLGGKWLGFLKELAPGVSRAAFLFHPEVGTILSILVEVGRKLRLPLWACKSPRPRFEQRPMSKLQSAPLLLCRMVGS